MCTELIDPRDGATALLYEDFGDKRRPIVDTIELWIPHKPWWSVFLKRIQDAFP